MEMRKLSIKEAEDILLNDTTYRKSVYFCTNNRKYNRSTVEINGVMRSCVIVDRGQISSREQIGNLIAASLMGGMYTC